MMSALTFELKCNCFLAAEEVEVCVLSDGERKEQEKKKPLCFCCYETALPDPSEAPRLGSVNLPGCLPAVEHEGWGAAGAFIHALQTEAKQFRLSVIVCGFF